MNKTFEEMTVKELREEMGRRGLPKQENGKKFTKSELIERLTAYDADVQKEINKADQEVKQTEPDVNIDDEPREGEKEAEKEEQKDDDYIVYAKTLAEIEQKYGNRKKQKIYDNELKVGSYVVFVHYVEARNGNIYKKLRTAKVVGINRKKELVRIVTLLGTEMELHFEELLYIKGSAKNCSYPKDITMYLKEQRTEKGKVIINERFAEDTVNG